MYQLQDLQSQNIHLFLRRIATIEAPKRHQSGPIRCSNFIRTTMKH